MRAAGAWLAVLGVACGEPASDDGACEVVPAEVGEGEPLDGTLSIGVRRGGEFAGLTDEGPMELVRGSQGGWMVVPMLRVEAREVDLDVSCGWVKIEAAIDGDALLIEHVQEVGFEARGSFLDSEDVLAFLSLDLAELEDRSCRLRASVDVGAHSIDASIDGVLVNDE